jgi:hypothetical protein
MDMFGGLTKTSSRIALAAALGLTLGGVALKATPAKAADLGGDCCADLEERVAELEATTVRKGNKKVSVTLSGWVVKTMNFWDSGVDDGFAVGDKDYDLGTRFAVTGSATIAPGWSGGFNITVTTNGTTFGVNGNEFDEFTSVNSRLGNTTYGNINTLYSFIYIKSDHWGTLNWGHLSPASDNPAVLADASGTVIESNFVGFEGGGFTAKNSKGASTSFNAFWLCSSAVAPGADCFGAAEPAVRYDSPTWGGFRFETSYGTASVVPEILDNDASINLNDAFFDHPRTPDSNFWDAAAFYTADWNSIKLSAAYAFTWLESNPLNGGEEHIHQVGGTIMHKPSGLGIYAMGEWEDVSQASNSKCPGIRGTVPGTVQGGPFSDLQARPVDGCLVSGVQGNLPDTDMWGVKPFWRKTWSALGATTIYGEYAQYNDFFGLALAGSVNSLNVNCIDCTITSSELQRWGLGVVQEIDSAAMHVWARWQHLGDLDVSVVDRFDDTRQDPSFDDTDLFQVGGIIFF